MGMMICSLSLPLRSMAIMAIQPVRHSINQAECQFVYAAGLGRGLKQQYLSPPAVPLPSLSLFSLAFQLFLFLLLLRCPSPEETLPPALLLETHQLVVIIQASLLFWWSSEETGATYLTRVQLGQLAAFVVRVSSLFAGHTSSDCAEVTRDLSGWWW